MNSIPASEHSVPTTTTTELPRHVNIRCDSGDWRETLRRNMPMFPGLEVNIIVPINGRTVLLKGQTAEEIIKAADALQKGTTK